MSFTGIQATVDFYTAQEAYLTNEMTDIMMKITRASKDTTKLTEETGEQKDAVREAYDPDSAEYKDAMDQIQDDYDFKLAEITEWESELETQKDELETEIKATKSYEESFTSMLKQNVSNDFKYAGSSSTTTT